MNKEKSVVTRPYRGADIVREQTNKCIEGLECYPIDDDECFGEDPDAQIAETSTHNTEELDVSSVKFANDIKVDFIPSIDFRIMCRFLGLTSVNDVKNHPYNECPLITMMLMESLVRFMKHEGYSFEGELNFDRQGNSIPPEKTVWKVKGREVSFTTTGFMYFAHKKKMKKQDKSSNLVLFLYTNLDHGVASITCYTKSSKTSEKVVCNLEKFTEKKNCLRGMKLRDINMYSGTFVEVEPREECTWDNYYYTDDVQDIFELEVFGILKNVKQYNEHGITKRGIIVQGPPGTGKTTIVHIIWNSVDGHTVFWITPEIIQENQHRSYSSVKLLYKLADFVSPSVIMLEDIDLFAGDRNRGGDLMGLGSLMNVLDGVNTVVNAVTIASTNRIDTIEEALRNRPGRFDRIVEIPSLSPELRKRMFTDRLKSWGMNDDTLVHLVEKTDGWTGAEAQEFVNTLNLKSIRSKTKIDIIDSALVDEIIEVMHKFGVGENSGKCFGFGKNCK